MTLATLSVTRTDTDTDTLMYWIRAYHGCNEYDEKIYLFWRAREWASHVIASSM